MIGRTRSPSDRAELQAKILKLYAEKLPSSVIAGRCGCGVALVNRVLRDAGHKRAQSPIDRIVPGLRIGRLTVTERHSSGVAVRCDCGAEETRSSAALASAISIGADSKCRSCQDTDRRKNALVKRGPRLAVVGDAE